MRRAADICFIVNGNSDDKLVGGSAFGNCRNPSWCSTSGISDCVGASATNVPAIAISR